MSHEQIDLPIIIENEACMPSYASIGASGADVKAHIQKEIIVEPGTSTLVPTGIRLSIPPGYEIQIRPRSGLALKNQITVLNTPGTIDADYRGEVGVIIINHGKIPFVIQPGMRIAQFVLAPVVQANFVPTETLESTERGAGGFGHTGILQPQKQPQKTFQTSKC